MQIEIISFTARGQKLGETIKGIVETYGSAGHQRKNEMAQPLQEWCRQVFTESRLLIFVGAAGIAVRTIAPFLKSKLTDPAVLVVDEAGSYVIPILSGHMGGANEWAKLLAEALGAAAVITTATDVNGLFAVDVFARKNHLTLTDTRWAKEISAALLGGEQISFACEGRVRGRYPKGLVEETQKHGISVGIHRKNKLYPKAVILGLGCRKGKEAGELERFILNQLEGLDIAVESVAAVASVDKKQEEPGILEFCKKYQLPFLVFTAKQLEQAPGSYPESGFVKQTVGVGNVCERAAICALYGEAGRLIMEKRADHGMTMAAAEKEWSVTFE